MPNERPDPMLYPRPQLVRDEWTDLGGEWGFSFDDDRGMAERWYEADGPFDRTITVPYPPESKLSGVHDPSYHPVVWYRRTFGRPALGEGERLLLHLGAVDYLASVWVNGRLLGGHEGGHTPFSLDVTEALDPARDEQTVVVRAEDRPTDVSQPRGKQDWLPEPHEIWYHRTTGIWQPVWLEAVPATYLEDVRWTSDLARGTAGLEVRLGRPPAGAATLQVRLRLGDEVLAEQSVRDTDAAARCEVSVPALRHGPRRRRMLWSPQSPTLVDAELVLTDGATVDEVRSYVGFRSVGVDGGRFLLNGRPYYLRLVLEQGYWPQSHLAAPDPDALRRQVRLAKRLGFNGVRVHQKVEDPRFLYWCDRLGLLVWAEMPSAYEFSAQAVERLVREWLDAVRRDRSHPCVVTWVPFNESWGVPDIATCEAQRHHVTALYHLTKALDPTRPVISNDGWEHTESDIWGVHDYASTGARLRERYGSSAAVRRMLYGREPGRRRVLLGHPERRGQPVVLTEFGGLSLAPAAGQKWFGYATVGSLEDLLARFRELVTAILASPDIAGFCYTQLTDTLQERNGLLTEDRRPKLPVEAIRGIVTGPPARSSRTMWPLIVVGAARRAATRLAWVVRRGAG